MVVHYPRTVCKNSYAEHEVTGKHTHKKKKKLQVIDLYGQAHNQIFPRGRGGGGFSREICKSNLKIANGRVFFMVSLCHRFFIFRDFGSQLIVNFN